MFNIFRKKKKAPYTSIIDDDEEKTEQKEKVFENKKVPFFRKPKQ